MAAEKLGGKSRDYRVASERLHRDTAPQERHAANHAHVVGVRAGRPDSRDFYGLFRFLPDIRGTYFDAGCGAGGAARHLSAIAPGLQVYGADIWSLRLTEAARRTLRRGPHAHAGLLAARFVEAGFAVEERIVDDAAFGFLTFVLPARWMPPAYALVGTATSGAGSQPPALRAGQNTGSANRKCRSNQVGPCFRLPAMPRIARHW